MVLRRPATLAPISKKQQGIRGATQYSVTLILAANEEQKTVADCFQSCCERVLATGKLTRVCLRMLGNNYELNKM